MTKGERCDIICKLSPRATDKRSLKIEQQEIKYKAKISKYGNSTNPKRRKNSKKTVKSKSSSKVRF